MYVYVYMCVHVCMYACIISELGVVLLQLAVERLAALQDNEEVPCSPFLELFDEVLCSQEQLLLALEQKPLNYTK